MVPMHEEHHHDPAEPEVSDLQLSEGKSLSFLATNIVGPIELGGLPPVNGTGDAADADSVTPEPEPASNLGDTPAPPETE